MVENPPTAVAQPPARIRFYSENFTIFFLAFIGGLALSRLLFEAAFPQFQLLARPYGAFPFALLLTSLLWALWRRLSAPLPALHLTPLLLNSLWLFDPTVDLVASRLIFAATVWLTAVALYSPDYSPKRGFVWLALALLPIYLLTMSTHVGAADTFEFQVVAARLEIAHPTGYPLYLLLGKLFTLLPISTLAWRLNFASVLYALVAMSGLYALLCHLKIRPSVALLAAVVMGLSRTFWSQAIIAEVYALHSLLVLLLLGWLAWMSGWQAGTTAVARPTPSPRHLIGLAFLFGLGLTNHLTTVFVLPAAAFTILLEGWRQRPRPWGWLQHPWLRPRTLAFAALAFALPLLLYAYLPIRWQAINQEPMGLARFVEWVMGGRFQGALQWRAWLDDPTRYEIVGRLFLDNWGWLNLAVAVVGLLFLAWRHWPTAVPLLLLWLGNSFYALNYYVPDLAVFVGPAQLVVSICWAVGVATLLGYVWQRLPTAVAVVSPWLMVALLPSLLLAVVHWPLNDQSANDGLEAWGRQVLALPLAADAAILADSEKIAPLLYLQVAEGIRPDLDISVWPDEAAYLAQVNGRVANGQTVYLARFLPGLQGMYHLRAMGPLTEVAAHPLTELPADLVQPTAPIEAGPIQLLGYALAEQVGQTAVTFYWQSDTAVADVWQVYVRFRGQAATGQHPANNFYPTNAWRTGEIVSDYHQLVHPLLAEAEVSWLEVALAPPFTAVDLLDWQPVAAVTLPAADATELAGIRPYRWQMGGTAVAGGQFASQSRPQTPLTGVVVGVGSPEMVQWTLQPVAATTVAANGEFPPLSAVGDPFVWPVQLGTDVANGRYQLQAAVPGQTAVCGWLQPPMSACVAGEVEISGVALSPTAVNYGDQIALVDYQLTNELLEPGGQLGVQFSWMALAPIDRDYTLFLQVVDENDRIVGQVDSWPVQGTRPTSQWQAGQRVGDGYSIQLGRDLPAGAYRLLVGWYVLADGRRLPVVDEAGQVVEDRLIISGLHVK